jgi:regulator of sirC expression with transglutaminase-like and TPR domain
MMPFQIRVARLACILALAVGPVADHAALVSAQTRPAPKPPAPVQPPAGATASQADPETQAQQLVVMIRGTMTGESVIGAGVIFGATQDRLYVATANHVVRRGCGPQAAQRIENLEVKLHWLPGEWAAGQMLDDMDADLDLAVLSVKTARGPLAGSQSFARLGRPAGRKDGVYALGCPGSRQWEGNIQPDPISAVTTSTLTFQTQVVQQGHSGGGLFNDKWELIGVIKQDQPPNAVAIRIDAVIDQLKQWGYTVALSPAPVMPTTAATPPPAIGGATPLVGDGGSAPASPATGVVEVRRLHDRDAWGDSLPLLKRLIDEQPKSPELFALRSHAFSHLERPSEALADGEQAVKLGPTVAEAYLRRGEAYSAQGKHQLAIADYDQAIKLNPKEDEAFANRAAALASAGHNEKALEAANRALAMRTDRYEYWVVRGEIHALLQHPSNAIDDLTQAIKLRPQRATLYRERANAYVTAKQFQPALQDLNEALRLEPDEPDTLAARGMLYSHIGNMDAARADLGYALRLRPGQKEWTEFLQRLPAANSSSGAGPSTGGTTNSPPPPAGGYARLLDDAVAAMRAQRTAEAGELVDQMIRLDASRSEGWSLRGSLAMNAFDNLPTAYEAYENALARGGAIYFRLAHDHGMDQQPCTGMLTITSTSASYAGDTGGHRFNWPYATIQEAAINDFYGSALGMFHIKSQAQGSRSVTYNFVAIRLWDQQIVNRRPDAEMLLGFINRQRTLR